MNDRCPPLSSAARRSAGALTGLLVVCALHGWAGTAESTTIQGNAPSDVPVPAGAVVARWAPRLASLSPADPIRYFELAEEVVDVERDEGAVELARTLYALAGRLDPWRLAGSACLALADLEVVPARRDRLLALGLAHGAPPVMVSDEDARRSPVSDDLLARLFDGLSAWRTGDNARAARMLQDPDLAMLLEAMDPLLPGGVRRMREDLSGARSTLPRALPDEALLRMLVAEVWVMQWGGETAPAILLRAASREPLPDIDVSRLAEMLDVDVDRPWWRDGGWHANPRAP